MVCAFLLFHLLTGQPEVLKLVHHRPQCGDQPNCKKIKNLSSTLCIIFFFHLLIAHQTHQTRSPHHPQSNHPDNNYGFYERLALYQSSKRTDLYTKITIFNYHILFGLLISLLGSLITANPQLNCPIIIMAFGGYKLTTAVYI